MDELLQRRQTVRIPIVGRLAARARPSLDVRLLDLSLAGTRIEHLDLLRPGLRCTLEFPAATGSLVVSARVVWSNVIGTEQSPAGERLLRYQSGLEFVGLTAKQQAALVSILERLTPGGGVGDARLSL